VQLGPVVPVAEVGVDTGWHVAVNDPDDVDVDALLFEGRDHDIGKGLRVRGSGRWLERAVQNEGAYAPGGTRSPGL
jgi:hypothetical protein